MRNHISLLWVFTLLMIPLSLRGTILAEGKANIILWAVDSLTRVQPEEKPPSGRAALSVRLQAAKNEYEAFQVIVRAEGKDLEEVNLDVSDLKDKKGHRISKDNIKLFREHYIQVVKPTPRSPYPPAWYPDALIPFVNPINGKPLEGGRFDAVPCKIEAGRNQPFWIDIYVPKDAHAGTYKGIITVRAKGEKPVEIALNLEVWNFALPNRPSTKSNFGWINLRQIAQAHKVPPDSLQAKEIAQRYCEAMLDHRIMPGAPLDTVPEIKPDGSIDSAKIHKQMNYFMNSRFVNSFCLPFGESWPFRDPLGADRQKAIKYLSSWYDYLKANGWEESAYTYIIDEPNDAEAYEKVRQFAKLVHEANRKIKFLCTEQTITSDPSWGDLYGAVDIWVPLFCLYDEKTAEERLKKGEEIWTYTALCQGKEETPFWQLDFPLLNYRIPLWINWRYGCKGLLYWSCLSWPEGQDMWTNPLSCYDRYNGEGMLFYPGSEAGFDGPVASVRLKAIREGMEDYEYFQILADRGDKAWVDQQVKSIARSWWDWEKEPKRLLELRQKLGQRIVKLASGRGGISLGKPRTSLIKGGKNRK